MDEPIFEIPQKRYGRDSQVITMRITKRLLASLDAAATQSNRSRNEILTMALEFSLDHLVITEAVTGDSPEQLSVTAKAAKATPKDET